MCTESVRAREPHLCRNFYASGTLYVYFDNDARAYAPHNAAALARWLNAGG